MIRQGVVLAAGLFAAAGVADPNARPLNPVEANDPRLERIREFFKQRDCPAHEYAEDFLRAADENQLDWRLLPSLSLVESGGGKQCRNKNMFGWDNGRQAFTSHQAGIYLVAARLHNSDLYRDKNLHQVLRTYNPAREEYPQRVIATMDLLGPAPEPVN
jgi:hypothetical protein